VSTARGTAVLPATRESLVAALGTAGEEARLRALDLIGRAYLVPVTALLGHRWQLSRADAEDLAQGFFARAIEKDWFRRFDASRGRFRAFLRSCLDDYARAEHRDATRQKRGGDTLHLSLDDALHDAPSLAGPTGGEAERLFEREWARSVLSIASAALRDECAGSAAHREAWSLFERYDLTDAPDEDRPTYASLAADLAMPVTQVTNQLAWARRRMREHVLDTLRALTGDDAEYRAEVRALLGIELA
jgi:RNA polymerase sigma-70 factor (ECF subfamily)